MVEDIEDDFDRFCRIGMGTGSEYSQSRPVYRDYLAAPTEISRNRTGSLRETGHKHHHRHEYSGFSRKRFSRTTTTDDVMGSGRSATMRRHSLAPTYQSQQSRGSLQYAGEDMPLDRPSSTRAYTPTQRITPPVRKGSSGVALPPPINVFNEDDTPKPYGPNVVRVRSFRRTKAGLVDETEKKRRLSHEIVSSPMRKGSKPRNAKSPAQADQLKLSDRCETARSIRRRSFTENNWSNNITANVETEQNDVSECSESNSIRHSCVGFVTSPYKVQVLGADQVGKTTMCTQFLTPESLDASFDSGGGKVLETVTVDVDGQLTSLLLIDSGGLEDPDFEVMDSADAYLVVYAIDDRESFKSAQTIISEILGKCKIASAIVLVGNKADLARVRSVSSDEGRHLATVYSCGFYEVSISLNHQVNELLVGLVSAIKAANEHVNEERQRLSRIVSIKTDPSDSSCSHETSGSFKQKFNQPRRHSSMGKSIKHFFKKHFSLNGT